MKLVKQRSAIPFLSAAVLALVASGCGNDATGVGSPTTDASAATVRVLLTDAPSDYIASAEVDIGAVELVSADGAHVTLSDDGTDGFVNLLDFQDAATMQLAEADIEPGSFSQLRLIVEAARVQLADGYAFRDGSTEKDLKVPSGAQTGIKLNLQSADGGGPLEIVPGETVLVLDFDVSKSFVMLGNFETPAGVHGVIFKPTIKVTGQDVAASISGTVSTEIEGQSVEGLTVKAEPTDGGEAPGYTPQAGTALTDADGNYTIPFLVPASYAVSVDGVGAGVAADPESQSVTLGLGENATGVDFELVDVTGSISGTVSTELDGVSVEGLTVTATADAEGVHPVTATTDADGAYTIDGVVPGSYVVTVAVGDGQLTDPADAAVDVGASEDVTDVDFAIVEDVRGSISGTVSTSLDGVSVEGLTVTADPAADGAENVTTTTASDGTYEFPALDPGSYTITVTVESGLATDPASKDVDLADSGTETGVDFEVVEAS